MPAVAETFTLKDSTPGAVLREPRIVARTAPEPMARPHVLPKVPSSPLTPPEVYAVLSRVRPPDSVIVNESTSTMAQQIEWLPTVRTGSFFATASGGIGWAVPAAVGVALGDRDRGVDRKSTRLNSSHIQKSRMPSSA